MRKPSKLPHHKKSIRALSGLQLTRAAGGQVEVPHVAIDNTVDMCPIALSLKL